MSDTEWGFYVHLLAIRIASSEKCQLRSFTYFTRVLLKPADLFEFSIESGKNPLPDEQFANCPFHSLGGLFIDGLLFISLLYLFVLDLFCSNLFYFKIQFYGFWDFPYLLLKLSSPTTHFPILLHMLFEPLLFLSFYKFGVWDYFSFLIFFSVPLLHYLLEFSFFFFHFI